MDNKRTRNHLATTVGLVVAALLTGQVAIAANTPNKVAGKSAKATTKAKKTKRAKSTAQTVAPPTATPVAAVAPSPAPGKPASSSSADSAHSAADSEENPELRALTRPISTIEGGVLGVTESNWKFGQYNGLPTSGAYGIGNFDLRGGGAYDSGDATRWRLTGRNIGLETREFTGEYKDQGRYKLNFGYDQILRYGQGTYQTPYLGVGGNNLTLPDNWPYPTNAGNIRTLPGSAYNDFRGVDLSTKRRRVDGGFSYFLSPEWEIKGSMRHEDKNGLDALGAHLGTSGVGGAVILPNPISQTTDQINASLNFTGEKAFGQFAYYGSIFHNDYNDVTFGNAYSRAGVPTGVGRMSTMPGNQFHQFNLNGGYNFSTDTKLIGTGSYGRNWQDQSFLPYNTAGLNSTGFLPRSNLGGDVEFKSASLKLTHRQTKDLNLAATYKYDERENNTPIAQYTFANAGGLGPDDIRSNTPYSKRNQQGNLDLNYSFAQGHWLKLGYELLNIDRWCNGTWTSCVNTGTTTENTGRIDYRGTFFDKLNTKLGYAYSSRDADKYNQDAAWAASYTDPAAIAFYNQITALGIPAFNGPATTAFSTNPFNIAGMSQFNLSNRDRHFFNSMVDYQITDKLSVGLNGSYRYDNYPKSAYGLQSSKNWSINFDTNYAFNENTSGHVFYTYQNIASKALGSTYGQDANLRDTIGQRWSSNMTDNIDTVGLGLKHKGLFSGKLDVTGDFLYSNARTLVDVSGRETITGVNIAAASLPEVKSQTYTFKLDAKYIINKSSAAHLTYLYQHLISNDYIYTGMQPAGTPVNVMPTLERAPIYSINAIGLSYNYQF